MAHYFIANHDKRFVAIASPKCASSAVRSWFLQTAGVHPGTWRAINPHLVDGKRLTELDAYARVLFVRDPLRRLVGFYWTWVVCDPTEWCFVDERRALSLAGTTFRDLVEGIDRARRQGRMLQHHLIAQVAGLPTDRPLDHLALVERLDDELAALNQRFGLTGYHQLHPRREMIDSTLAEPVMDRRPEWFEQRRAPAFELFYDAELAATVRRCFADDVALYATIPGACPLRVDEPDVRRPLAGHQTVSPVATDGGVARLAAPGRTAVGRSGASTDEIFISIAAYRDEFLPFTIRSALAGARHPERLRFGICWQAADGETLDPYLDDPRFRVLRFPYWESRGYGWSRAEVQKLYRGEQYHLLIDSHSYLAPGWDENLIAQLERKPSEKPLLTTSAPPFTFGAHGEVVLPWAGTEGDGVPLIRCSQHSANGFLDFQMSRERSPGPDTRTCFMVCNFVFTHGRWIVDVPEDPDMINACHESALAVRTYTHGYDLFVPDELQVWHLDYGNYREGRRKVWETKSRSWQSEATNRQLKRLDALIYDRGDPGILGRYGRGTVRTVQGWAAQAGVDLRWSPGSREARTARPSRSDRSVRSGPTSAASTRNLVWLASFPKSGSTWVRLFIATYLSGRDRIDLDMVDEYSRSESVLAHFARAAGKPVQELTPEDIAAQRLAVQEHLSNVVGQHVVKTHNARLDYESRPLIFSRYTRAGVYVVRNPLDIVESLADHANTTLDEAIRLMNRPSHRLRATDKHAAQHAGSWSHHVRTWIRHKEFPLLVLRYEDLQADPLSHFKTLITFMDWDYDAERLRRAVELTSFASLQRAEDARGFAETSPVARSGRFFRHGQTGRFKDVLSAEQVAQVIRDHGAVMKMLGYEV